MSLCDAMVDLIINVDHSDLHCMVVNVGDSDLHCMVQWFCLIMFY